MSRSTKIFLFSDQLVFFFAVFCDTLLFPSDFTLLCGYTESFLFLSLSPIPTRLFHLVISLSLDPTTDIVLLPNKTPKCSAAAHWRHSPIELLLVR